MKASLTADDESLQSLKHYADHCHSHKQYSTQAISQMYKTKLFQQKLYATHTTSGTSYMLTASSWRPKMGMSPFLVQYGMSPFFESRYLINERLFANLSTATLYYT